MLTKRELILVGIEATYNTDPTPTGTDAVQIENLSWSYEGLRMNERPIIRSNINMLKHLFGGTLMQISFDVEMKYSGTAGTAPEMDVLLRSCGFTVTNVPSTSDTYAPISSFGTNTSCTIYYYQDGIRYILTGCRGNVSFNLETGNRGLATFTMTGHSTVPTDTPLASPTYDAEVPVPLISVPFTVDSFSAIINALTLDVGNTVATPPDISATDGYSEIQITSRDPNGSIDPEAELIATEAFDANFRAGTVMALTTGVIGSSAGSRYAFTLPAVAYRSMAPGDRDGIRTYDMGYGAADTSSGDDSISLAFT